MWNSFFSHIYQHLCTFFWKSIHEAMSMCMFKIIFVFLYLENETAEQWCRVEKDALHTLTWCRSESILATSNAQNIVAWNWSSRSSEHQRSKKHTSEKITRRVVLVFCGPAEAILVREYLHCELVCILWLKRKILTVIFWFSLQCWLQVEKGGKRKKKVLDFLTSLICTK